MKITEKEVDYAAKLARLSLSAEEKGKFVSQLQSIISYIEQLNGLDTRGINPTSHALENANPRRQDAPRKSSREDIENMLSNAPEREGNFFRVKKVIE